MSTEAKQPTEAAIDGNTIVLRSCPFCAGEPKLILRGNAFTKSRSAEVYCRSCHTKQVTGAIRNSLAWCEEKAVEKWNRRSGA